MEHVLSTAGLLSEDVKLQLLQASMCRKARQGWVGSHASFTLLLAVQGKEYWALERRLCSCMQAADGLPERQPVSFTEHDVLKASEQKSFDYRVGLHS